MSKRGGRPPQTADDLAQRRQTIIDATISQIEERGANSVRMTDIAKSAKVSIGTIQYYFDSRDHIVHEAFASHARQVVGAMSLIGASTPDAVTAFTRVLHTFLHARDFHQRTVLWMELIAASAREPKLRELLASVFDAWVDLIASQVRRGVAEGVFHPVVDEDIAIDAIVAMLDGLEVAHATHAPRSDRERIEKILVQSAAALLGFNLESADQVNVEDDEGFAP